MVASIRCKTILLAVLPISLSLAQVGPTGGGARVTGPRGATGSTGPTGPAPSGTGVVVVNSGVSSAVAVSGDGTLNPATGALTVTKSNGSSFSAVATSGSAGDLRNGTLPHAQLPALLSGDIPANAANTSGNAATATALASAPTLCPAGSYTLGTGATGNAQNCTALPAFPSGAIIGSSDTQALTNKTVDGVSPTTMGYLDATSSIQTQLNGTTNASNLSSGTLNHARLPALVSGDIPNNAANTTGLAATATALASAPTLCPAGSYTLGIGTTGNAQNCAALPAFPSGAIIGTSDTQALTNKTVDGVSPTTMGYLDATSSVQTQLNGKQTSLGYTAENTANKDAASGYAGLSAGTLLKTAEMPALTGDCTSSAGAVATICRPGVLISTAGPVSDPGGSAAFQFNNASGALTFSLPPGVAGFQRCYRNATGKTGAITVAVTTGNTIDLNGANGTSGTGTLVSTGALGDFVCLVSDVANHWYANASSGTWTNN